MNELNLQKFCNPRHSIAAFACPFNQGEFTWACNGWLIIGVPLSKEVVFTKAPNNAPYMVKHLPDIEPTKWFSMPKVNSHHVVNGMAVSIGEDDNQAHFSIDAITLISKLPGVAIAPTGPITPAWLTFDGGGIGSLMPCRPSYFH
jgi:hypothetical protein